MAANKMAASIEKSRDMQMRDCDVVSHVTDLDPSEPQAHLNRSALWRRFYHKKVQLMLVDANLCKWAVTS